MYSFKLTHVQQREFVRVTLHCCGMEGEYNPYYTLVLNNLCANSYDHRFTLQYAVWDLLRELDDGGISDDRAANVAKTLAFLFARGNVDVTILKTLDFTDLSKASRRFLDTLIRTLLIATQSSSPLLRLPKGFKAEDTDTETVEAAFDKALAAPELAGGLAWVIQGIQKTPAKGTTAVGGEVVKIAADAALGVLARAI
jgi:nucleolar MIF4G domain-containing protein 1